jgi:hypothetical protein
MKQLYYKWQLKRARKALTATLRKLPDDWAFFPEEYAGIIAEWAQAHCRVVDFQLKLEQIK